MTKTARSSLGSDLCSLCASSSWMNVFAYICDTLHQWTLFIFCRILKLCCKETHNHKIGIIDLKKILKCSSFKSSYYKSSSVCLSVCLSVCSLSPPRSFDGSSPNLVGVCRWTSELPLRGSFSKRSTGRWVNGSLSLSLYYIFASLTPHSCKRRLLLCCYCI